VPGEPWTFYLLPYPMYNSVEGLSINLAGGWFKGAPAGPIPTGISIAPYASLATSGSRTFSLTWDNSGRIPGWRLLAIAGYEHMRRAPYFGLGNATVVNDSLEAANGGDAHYYRYELTRTTGIVAVQRRIIGPLRVHAGAQWRRYRALPLGGAPTALGTDLARGAVADTGAYTSVEVRGALILDTRDEEASASRGIMLQAVVARALKGAGDFDYTRWGADAREYLPLTADRTVVLALRQAVEIALGHIPFPIAYERLTTWRPDDGFGSTTTLRQNLPGRWLGPNDALASVDLRYKWWDGGFGLTPIRLWLVAHADAGRVWQESERFRWTGLHSGYGGGAIAQLGRGTFFGLEIGYSPDAHLQFNTTVTLGY
jgi:outer membrane protein assembly factor BamA